VSTIDITGVIAASPSAATCEAEPAGSQANYEVAAHGALKVESSRTEDGILVFTVSDPETGIFGTGGKPLEAIQDLGSANREHREVLEAQDHLAPALQRQLEYLQRR
jgi:hypothetical protein